MKKAVVQKKTKKTKVFVVGGALHERNLGEFESVEQLSHAQQVWFFTKPEEKEFSNILEYCRRKNIPVKYQNMNIVTERTKNSIADYVRRKAGRTTKSKSHEREL